MVQNMRGARALIKCRRSGGSGREAPLPSRRHRTSGDTCVRQARILIQVAQRAKAKDVPPALPAMFGRVVEHVAALAQGGQIGGHVVARIMVEMRAGEHHIGRADAAQFEAIAHRDPSPARGSPAGCIAVPPASVA